jgi:hypothetical protein
VLLAPARPAYYSYLLNPSSMKRLISSDTLMPERLETDLSFCICAADNHIDVRFTSRTYSV